MDELDELLRRGAFREATELGLRLLGPEIYGYLASVVRDDGLAGDAFSAFCEDLWRGLPSFRAEASFRTWAYKLAWHAALRTLEDPYRKRGEALGSEIGAVAEEVRTRTAMHLRTSVHDRMSELRAALSPDEQTLLTLRLDRGLSWREIAEVMSTEAQPVGVQALWKRFERLKERLRELAAAAGLTSSDTGSQGRR